ncbi:MAG TPA: hypothetical protein PKZ27_06705 [Rhodocyclaceae bacterium]|nr:hypothetical protein [Rhodocyclaceae bacterium]
MHIRFLFLSAGGLAAITVPAVAFLVLPEGVWNVASLVALALFCLAVGFTLWFPFALPKPGGASDAARIASIGPVAIIVLALLGWTALAFLVGILGHATATWAMIVLAVAGFLTAFLSWTGAARIADDVGRRDGPSRTAIWTEQLGRIAAGTSEPEALRAVEHLTERVRYAASAAVAASDDLDTRIELLIAELGGADSNVRDAAVRIEKLLDEREARLRAVRTKA